VHVLTNMNFFKSRNVIGNLIGGQWRKQIVETGGSRRSLCNKAPEVIKTETPAPVKPVPPPAAPPAPEPSFRLPGYKPSKWDVKMLLWSGRFKTVDQIPEFVSFEMIDAARNRMRVKMCYAMMGFTILGCLFMVMLGKQAQGRHETLTGINMEKKARWREEYKREQAAAAAAAAALAEKP